MVNNGSLRSHRPSAVLACYVCWTSSGGDRRVQVWRRHGSTPIDVVRWLSLLPHLTSNLRAPSHTGTFVRGAWWVYLGRRMPPCASPAPPALHRCAAATAGVMLANLAEHQTQACGHRWLFDARLFAQEPSYPLAEIAATKRRAPRRRMGGGDIVVRQCTSFTLACSRLRKAPSASICAFCLASLDKRLRWRLITWFRAAEENTLDASRVGVHLYVRGELGSAPREICVRQRIVAGGTNGRVWRCSGLCTIIEDIFSG